MDRLDVLRLLLAHRLGPDKWRVSEDGAEGEFNVNKVDAGTGGDIKDKSVHVWVLFEYTNATGEDTKIKALMPLHQLGIRGGKDTIYLNDKPVEKDDFVMGPPRVGIYSGGIYVNIVLEFKYELNGKVHRTRFDGEIL